MATINLMTEITSRYSKMTKAEKKVADFVLSSPQEALSATITDLSKLCDVGRNQCVSFLPHPLPKRLSGFQIVPRTQHFQFRHRAKERIDRCHSDVKLSGNCRTRKRSIYACVGTTLHTLNFHAIYKNHHFIS